MMININANGEMSGDVELDEFTKELALLKAYVMRGEDLTDEEFAEQYPRVAAMTTVEAAK